MRIYNSIQAGVQGFSRLFRDPQRPKLWLSSCTRRPGGLKEQKPRQANQELEQKRRDDFESLGFLKERGGINNTNI